MSLDRHKFVGGEDVYLECTLHEQYLCSKRINNIDIHNPINKILIKLFGSF